MGKAKGGKQIVDEYRMSIHLGLTLGMDALKAIFIGDKPAWQGRLETAGYVDLDLPDLFGGPTKSGGVEGRIYYLPGDDTQIMPDILAGRFGLTNANCPAFRGVSSIFFTGDTNHQLNSYGGGGGGFSGVLAAIANRNVSGGGFLWSANSPYVQTVWVTGERAPKTVLPTAHRMIGPDANPVHIIYEALTDLDYGMGASDQEMDYAAYAAAADTIFNEGFGISVLWLRQTEIENFVAEMLDHIQATVYTNPRTGLFSIKLLREDYDIGSLRRLNTSNSNVTRFSRKLWGDTVNEITVTWTNPVNEQEETVTRQNLANVVSQGSPVAASRNYYGIRSAELAGRIADRDVRTSSAPLAAIEVECLRSEWDILPGEILIADYPELGEGIEDLVMRVMNVDYGKPGDAMLKVTLLEDVFSLARPEPSGTPQTNWAGVAENPAPMAFTQVITLPAFLMTPMAPEFVDEVYPEVVAAVLAYQPGEDTIGYDMLTEIVATNGTPQWQSVGTKTVVGRAEMSTPLYPEAVSTITGIPLLAQGRGPRIGGFAFIGTGGDSNMEIALLRSIDADGVWTVDRGIMDTVPRFWPVGTPVWFLSLSSVITDDDQTRAAGESPEFKLLSRTSLGTLPFADAPTITGTLTARPHMPLRPANVKVNGVGFGDVDAAGASSLVITWANRNRTMEDGTVVPWGAGSITPEYLQETIITVYRQDGTKMFLVRGLFSESSFTLPIGYVQQEQKISIRVSSERKGLTSLQSHVLFVKNIPQVGSPAAPPADITVGTAGPPPVADPNPTPDPLPPPGTAPPAPAGNSGGGGAPTGQWRRIQSY